MNHLQLLLFSIYSLSVFACGMFIYQILDKNYSSKLNNIVFLGEVLLLGNIFVIGQLLLLSSLHLYRGPYLWACIILDCTLIFNTNVRQGLKSIFTKKIHLGLPLIIFVFLLIVWTFRNWFPLIDVDSVNLYLYIQKLWLSKGTSFVGGPLNDGAIFAPSFNCVPYSLGISIFPKETLFAQFINIFWRFIALILVFGYTSYRFNKWYGLAASMFVLFNEHFFYSGVAICLIVNGAVTALIFASIYNLWESRRQNCSFRFLLGIIFASQIMANKYQMAYVMLGTLFLCLFVQKGIVVQLKEIVRNKRWLSVLLCSCFISGFWYIRNLIVTGDPVFFVWAGRLGVYNWTPEKDAVLLKFYGLNVSPFLGIKYASYLFIWPGIAALKYVFVAMLFTPLIFGFILMKSRVDKEMSIELFFWLSICIITVFGIFLAQWSDPKIYRYPICIFSFTAIFALHYILTQFFGIKLKFILCVCILFLSFIGGRNESWRVVMRQREGFQFPTYKENVDTICNKIHTSYALGRHFQFNLAVINKLIEDNKDKLGKMAWDFDAFGHALPVFFLPDLPVVCLWTNSVIGWDSYNDLALIKGDLRKHSIDWIITTGPKLETAEEFAKRAAMYERYPKTIYLNYDFFPEELIRVKY